MKTENEKKTSQDMVGLFQKVSVPVMFIIICAVCIPISGLSAPMLINEIVTRMGRNAFLILSLLIPIMAGMGLNFGMTLGAMAAEIGLILVSDWQIVGIPGMVLAAILSVPISTLLGIFCGKILNQAKGREMITSYIMSFFINGIYQLVVLYLMGSIIPIKHSSIKLPRGYGIRNTVSLLGMRQKLDNLLAIKIAGIKIFCACSLSGSAGRNSGRTCAPSVRIWKSPVTPASMWRERGSFLSSCPQSWQVSAW